MDRSVSVLNSSLYWAAPALSSYLSYRKHLLCLDSGNTADPEDNLWKPQSLSLQTPTLHSLGVEAPPGPPLMPLKPATWDRLWTFKPVPGEKVSFFLPIKNKSSPLQNLCLLAAHAEMCSMPFCKTKACLVQISCFDSHSCWTATVDSPDCSL